MFTITYKGIPVACETAQDAVEFCDAADQPTTKARGLQTVGDLEDRMKKESKVKGTRAHTAAKQKRNAKARAAYRDKHPTTTTSRLQALPSKPTSIGPGRGKGSRANTSQAVIDTLKRSPSPLTLDEIDMDLEKSGWPYRGQDRKGAIRATLARLKSNGTVSTFLRGEGSAGGAMKMFRLERTNGDTPSPVEQVLNGPTREERAEVEDSEQAALRDEARADAEGDPDAREF